jgi:MFS family permease
MRFKGYFCYMSDSDQQTKVSSSPLSIKNYRYYLAARFSYTFAMQMVVFEIAIYIYELTNNKLSLGILGLSEVIPAITLALYAGHIIDISDKRTILFRNAFFYLIVVTGLTLVVSAKARQMLGITAVEYIIYGLIFCTGVLRAFNGPAQQSIVAQLVPKAILPKAITVGGTAWQSAAVSGPILAGIAIQHIGIVNTFWIAVFFLGVSLFAFSQIPKLPVTHTKLNQRTWESVKEGLQYVWKTKTLLGAQSVDMFAVLFGGATAMLPVIGKDILHVAPAAIGVLKAAQGVGTIFVLFWLSRFPFKKDQGKIMLICVALYGLMIIILGLSTSFWLSLGVLLFAGVCDGISVITRSTILQLFVPDEMRGRVSSVNSMFINSSNELGEFESGVTAKYMGTVPSIIFGGCMTILVVAIAWVKAPTLRKMKY